MLTRKILFIVFFSSQGGSFGTVRGKISFPKLGGAVVSNGTRRLGNHKDLPRRLSGSEIESAKVPHIEAWFENVELRYNKSQRKVQHLIEHLFN
jgi:hypothetical protein